MLGGTPYQGGLPSQPVWITPFGVESFLYVKAKEWGNPSKRGNLITAPKPAKTHDRIHGCQRSLAWLAILTISPPKSPKRRQVKHGIGQSCHLAGSNWRLTCNNDVEAKSSFIRTKEENKRLFFFSCAVLCDRVISFWASPHIPGVAYKENYFFTMGRWGTSPPGGPRSASLWYALNFSGRGFSPKG